MDSLFLFPRRFFYALRTAHLRMVIRLQLTVCIDKIKTIRNSKLAASGVSYASTIGARAGTGIGGIEGRTIKIDAVRRCRRRHRGRQRKTKAF